MKRIIILIAFSLAIFTITSAQSLVELDKVKEIKLLESSREDVRKIFADYFLSMSDDLRHYEFFSTKNANITIWYSSGKCTNNFDDDWNVPEWKVNQINISPETSIEPKDIGINLSKYKKEKVYVNFSKLYVYHEKELGIAYEVYKNKITKITFTPSKENFSMLCNSDRLRKYYSSKRWFDSKLKERRYIHESPNYPPDVINLILSLPEITLDCIPQDSTENKSCVDGVKIIAVFAVAKDPENDVLTYDYKVTGGKITGRDSKVLWDLSGVKAGTYTITATADDGGGLHGKSITKTLIIKECPDCNTKK